MEKITFWWTEVSKDWFDWLKNSANLNVKYRWKWNDKYKTNVDNDIVGYVIRWWGEWPLQKEQDYFIRKKQNPTYDPSMNHDKNSQYVWEAIDSDWNVYNIDDKFWYWTKKGTWDYYDNWKIIRELALEYWNSKDTTKLKSKSNLLNTAKNNNINYEWWELLNNELDKATQREVDRSNWMMPRAEARNKVRKEVTDKFIYPYKDLNGNNLKRPSLIYTVQESIKWFSNPTLVPSSRGKRKFIQ